MTNQNLLGKLVVAHPLNPKDGLDHTVTLIVTHTPMLTLGLQLNNVMVNLPLKTVFMQLGLWYDGDEMVYHGGVINPGKIHIVHSLDWTGHSTIAMAENIGVTNDISILNALSRGEGPEYFRACAGFMSWEDSLLDQQLDSSSKLSHHWEIAPATLETVFASDGMDQWHAAIEASVKRQVADSFNPFLG